MAAETDWRSGIDGEIAAQLAPLLRLGEPSKREHVKWPDYLISFGLGAQHIDGLIRMACDPALQEDSAGKQAIWAPVHAWRALGQLRAAAAVAPLMALSASLDDDVTADLDLPIVFGMVGPAAIAPLAEFLADPAVAVSPAATAMSGLSEIAGQHPVYRDECIGLIAQMLAPRDKPDPGLAGLAICSLLDLKAVEAINEIRDAFARDAVDISIAGDLEDVEIGLGLRDKRSTPVPKYHTYEPRPSDEPYDTVGYQEPYIAPPKIGRNEPCPCGSGKKYKKCCLV